MKTSVYLSLGSNVGDREENLRDALYRLEQFGQLRAVSSLYETEPVEVVDQAWFLNCAVELITQLGPEELLGKLLAIEKEMGRERTRKKGPRTIDIDILLFGKTVIQTDRLTLPHPSMQRRRFVLEPLAEIAGAVKHPVLGKNVRELLQELPSGQVVKRV